MKNKLHISILIVMVLICTILIMGDIAILINLWEYVIKDEVTIYLKPILFFLTLNIIFFIAATPTLKWIIQEKIMEQKLNKEVSISLK